MTQSLTAPLETSNSVEEYLEKNLSERQRKVIDFLDKIESDDAKKIYKTMLFCQAHTDMPAIELVLGHCLSEFVNALLRRNENERKVILEKAITDMNFYGCDEKKLKEATSNAFVKIKEKLSDELFKIQDFVKRYLEVKYKEGATNALAKNIKNSKDSANDFRHYNGRLTGDADGINSGISKVEDALISIGASYFQKLSGVNKILDDANLHPFKKPSDDTIKNVLAVLTNENEVYFFDKLNNHEWVLFLKGILNPSSKNAEPDYFWPQGNYLARIAKSKSDEVFEIIKPYLEKRLSKNIDVGHLVLMKIFKISENFPDDKNCSQKVGEAYFAYLQHDQNLAAVVNSHYAKDFLNDLVKRGCEDLVLQIAEKLLAMKPDLEKAEFNDFKTRFNDSANMADYYYEDILKVIKNAVLEKKSFQLFETLCKIFKDAVDGKFSTESNRRLCFNRSAIEEHEQDKYRNSAEDKLITAIRDVAEYIFENDSKNRTKVIGILEEKLSDGSEFLIFTRIILHLLRKYPETQSDAKHLAIKERFDDYHIHHEYYLLLQQEFKNLAAINKEKILGFISDGFEERKNTQVSDNAKKEREAYANRWLFDSLDCISDGLEGEWKDKYKELSKEFEKKKRPDLAHYIESEMVLDQSPLTEEELAKKSLSDIIKFLASWKPDGGFGSANPRGFGDVLEKDFEKNSRKYLDDLLQFKEVSNPTYLKRIFRALVKYHSKTEDDWKKIVELGKWVSDQLNESVDNDSNYSSYDSDAHWGWCKQEFARVISESFRSKENSAIQIPEELFKDVISVLEKLIFSKDVLVERFAVSGDTGDDQYYTRAINSCHGEAITAAIEFGLWLIRKNDKDLAAKLALPLLDKLIAEDKYSAGWAVLGRYLPWIMLIDRGWVKENLEKIFPRNSKEKFDAAWLTYINFVPPFDEAFEMLKEYYLLALKNLTDEEKENKRSHFKFGESIAAFYSRGKITLEDDLLKSLFEKSPKDGAAVISLIGRWCCNENRPPQKEIIDRFKKLWDWRVENSNKFPISIEEYQSFKWWYKSGLFGRKWALEQLLESTKKSGEERRPEIFIIGEKMFEDLQDYPKTAWEVIKLIVKVKGYFMDSDIDFIRQVFESIEKSDWSEIKKEAIEDKDEFCRKNNLDERFVSLYR